MQRLLNNLLTIAVIGLISTSASLAMAKGGGKSGGGKGGSSHKSSHKSGHKSSHGHNHHGTHKTSHSKHSHSRSHHVSHDHLRGWHGHDHYPVGYWFRGNYDVVDTGVVSTGVIGTGVVATDAPVAGIDVEFTKIEQVDAGDPAKNIAPTYRVSFHNNSDVDIDQPFDVAILAANDDQLVEGLPSSSARVDSLAADETSSVDIQLPTEALTMDSTDDGQTAPFSYVHTIIDSQKELVETDKANNLSVDSRDDIPAAAE